MPKLNPAVNAFDHQIGKKNAPITLVEYGDFECLHCGRANILINRLIKEMGDKLHYVFRNFPLRESHPNAFMAAAAAEAAANQSKFWEMSNLLFANQDHFEESLFISLADELQLDHKKFYADMHDAMTFKKIEMSFESGIRSGVNGTPGFFINDRRVDSYDESYESLTNAILLAYEEKVH